VTDNEINRFYSVVGENVKKARENAGFNQSEFATLLGLSRASVVNIEKGRQHSPLHVLWDISRHTRVSLASLFENVDQQNNSAEMLDSVDRKISELLKNDANSSIDKVAQFLKENITHHGL